MTRDDIIQLAREAWGLIYIPESDVSKLEKFAALAAAAEREACAQVCDEIEEQCYKRNFGLWPENCCSDEEGAEKCATAIRARGEP